MGVMAIFFDLPVGTPELVVGFVPFCIDYIEKIMAETLVVKLLFPKRRKLVCGEIILITGATHRLGRAIAYEFAKFQSKLVLWDVNEKGLQETAEEYRKLGAIAHTFMVNVGDKEEVYKTAEKTTKAFLPAMIEHNHGHIVTVASIAGL
ncbi:estradiol 17-beta-dehydrogenase 11-like [Liasis olivaceus]